MNEQIELIRKINKSIVHEDGTIDSFDKQLINLAGGIYDSRFPMVVDTRTDCLSYISDLFSERPLTMMTSTAVKIREKHDIGFAYVSQCKELLESSVLAFDSPKFQSSKIVLLDDFSDIGDPMIAICRTDKKLGYVDVNEITSIYDRENFLSYMEKAYEANCTFYIHNEKRTEQLINSFQFQVLDDLINALSKNYGRQKFSKSQYENDIGFSELDDMEL